MKKIIVLAVLMPMLLTACNTAPKKYEQQLSDKGASFALKVAKLGGCGENLKDVDESVMADASKSINEVTDSDLALSSAVGLLKDGFSGFSLNFFRTLTASSGTRSQHNCVIAWMPKSMASDKKDAVRRFYGILDKSARKNMPDQDYNVTSKVSLGYSVRYEPTNPEIASYASMVTRAIETKSPDWLGSKDAYLMSEGTSYIGRPLEDYTKKAPFDEVEYLKAVSKDLPDWSYIYVSPRKFNKPYPMILNQGHVYYFIEGDTSVNTDRHVSAL